MVSDSATYQVSPKNGRQYRPHFPNTTQKRLCHLLVLRVILKPEIYMSELHDFSKSDNYILYKSSLEGYKFYLFVHFIHCVVLSCCMKLRRCICTCMFCGLFVTVKRGTAACCIVDC